MRMMRPRLVVVALLVAFGGAVGVVAQERAGDDWRQWGGPGRKAGYGCSPVAYRDTIICSVGGPGQSVMAFRQRDGEVVWRSGDFLISEAPTLVGTTLYVRDREKIVALDLGAD